MVNYERHKMKEISNPLATEPVGKLIGKFAIPAVISMLVSSLYNIVDQIFIGQGVGMLGNAATNVAFPITIISTAVALLLGIGGATNYNLETGAGKDEKACETAGTGLACLVISGLVIGVVVLVFLQPLLHAFGTTKEVLLCSRLYVNYSYRHSFFCADNRRKSFNQGRQKPYILYGMHDDRSGA